jgi:coenzyme F420-reducing hydrogenase beta subunit
MKRKKKKKRNPVLDALKIAKRNSRNEEIALHGKPINYKRVAKSKKVYKRRKLNKKDLEND